MTIYQNSRYITAPRATPQRAPKTGTKVPAPVPTLFPKRPARKSTISKAPVSFRRIAIQGDRFDRLASLLLGDPLKWWMIADLNPQVWFPFDDLEPGSTIRIPLSATAAYTVANQTFVPQIFARVFDGQSKPA